MKRLIAPLLLIVALAAIAVAGYWFRQPPKALAIACTDPLIGCAFTHRGATINVRFASPPSPLTPFYISVHAPGARNVNASFQMVGMEMGFNRYDLRPGNNHTFGASVTLPVCISGRHDWTMTLNIDNTPYTLPFSTH